MWATWWASDVLRFLVALLAVVVAGGEVGSAAVDPAKEPAVSRVEQRSQELRTEKELIRLFADTLEQVKSKYVAADVSDRELIEAAIRGMISRLDPYSDYIPPKDLDLFRRGVEREFVGIGVQVSDRDGHLLITSPLFDTPAWHAGLRAGDRILKINDTSTQGLSLEEAIRLMSGDEGTEVTVAVLHPDETEPDTVTLKRERIQQPTVIGLYRNEQGVWDFFADKERQIAYVRITAFSGNTAHDLERILRALLEQGMRGLVVDLRFNPGGMLNQAVEVSDLFLRSGRIVSMEGRGTSLQVWDAQENGTLIPPQFPVAVLVNRFTASAAEIVAACLQDNRVATIVGERTWGKGSVQNIIVLEDGKSALKLTTAGYHRPSGQNIHRQAGTSDSDPWGVQPDEGCSVPFSNRDLRNLAALFAQHDELAKVRRRAGATEDDPATDASKASTFVDRQLEKSLELLRSRLVSSANGPAPEGVAVPSEPSDDSAAEAHGDRPANGEKKSPPAGPVDEP